MNCENVKVNVLKFLYHRKSIVFYSRVMAITHSITACVADFLPSRNFNSPKKYQQLLRIQFYLPLRIYKHAILLAGDTMTQELFLSTECGELYLPPSSI
jgi:hypothetical protein